MISKSSGNPPDGNKHKALISKSSGNNGNELVAGDAFDWSQVLDAPPANKNQGNQILHFNSSNKPYFGIEEAEAFVQSHFQSAKALTSDADVLRSGVDAVTIDGFYLELGVCTGKTINFIAALSPTKKIHGFDSFEGLPEDWVRSDISIPKGTFRFKNPSQLPPVLNNVALYKGWFSDTLPLFKQTIIKDEPIAFLHIDCDIYSSTNETFQILGDNIIPGTVIVFDEFYNYPSYKENEYKALTEFLKRTGYSVEYISYNVNHEQTALIIKP